MERHIRETEYGGVVNTLAAAQRVGFGGRFLYITASSVTSRSWATVLLNLYKGNTLVWRERAEHEIRGSGLEYTIIRAGILLNRPGANVLSWSRNARCRCPFATGSPGPMSPTCSSLRSTTRERSGRRSKSCGAMARPAIRCPHSLTS